MLKRKESLFSARGSYEKTRRLARSLPRSIDRSIERAIDLKGWALAVRRKRKILLQFHFPDIQDGSRQISREIDRREFPHEPRRRDRQPRSLRITRHLSTPQEQQQQEKRRSGSNNSIARIPIPIRSGIRRTLRPRNIIPRYSRPHGAAGKIVRSTPDRTSRICQVHISRGWLLNSDR